VKCAITSVTVSMNPIRSFCCCMPTRKSQHAPKGMIGDRGHSHAAGHGAENKGCGGESAFWCALAREDANRHNHEDGIASRRRSVAQCARTRARMRMCVG
jgi:hypothetical protein